MDSKGENPPEVKKFLRILRLEEKSQKKGKIPHRVLGVEPPTLVPPR